MSATRITDDLFMVSRSSANVYLLRGSDGLTLIDTGYAGTEDAILAAIARMDEKVSSLRTIVLTHSHPDHIGSAAAVASATGARVLVHPEDRKIAERGAGFRPLHAPPDFLSGLSTKSSTRLVSRCRRSASTGRLRTARSFRPPTVWRSFMSRATARAK